MGRRLETVERDEIEKGRNRKRESMRETWMQRERMSW